MQQCPHTSNTECVKGNRYEINRHGSETILQLPPLVDHQLYERQYEQKYSIHISIAYNWSGVGRQSASSRLQALAKLPIVHPSDGTVMLQCAHSLARLGRISDGIGAVVSVKEDKNGFSSKTRHKSRLLRDQFGIKGFAKVDTVFNVGVKYFLLGKSVERLSRRIL